MSEKKVIIVGGGPGGLAAGMLLSAKGFQVRLYEKQSYIGGRTSSFALDGYTFDLGPTLLCMPHIIEEIFQASNRDLHNYIEMKELNPLYTLSFPDITIQATRVRKKMYEQIEKHFPGEGENYHRFMTDMRKKLAKVMPIIQNKHDSLLDFAKWRSIRTLPDIELGKSLYDVLSNYFNDERLKLSFAFQSIYLGMSPWECPGVLSILSFIEHEYGVFHPIGGLNQLTKAMAKVIEEHGGEIFTDCGVRKLTIQDKRVIGIELEDGQKVEADEVVMNVDFAYGMTSLVDDKYRKKYSDKSLEKKKYSCSTFMIFAGVNGDIPLDHHTILFSNDYKKNIEEITKTLELSHDPSIYIQNASITDKTLAKEGKSTLYILAPVPNNFSNIDWNQEKDVFRDVIWRAIEKKTNLPYLRKMIDVEKIITPFDWEQEKFVYQGATFNLAHSLNQMLYFRPHNRSEELQHLWLVGGGTHPGSGLPTIFESARVTSKLLVESYT